MKRFGSPETLKEDLMAYGEKLKLKGHLVDMDVEDDDQIIFVVVSPLMLRVLTNLPQAAELMFVDSTGNCDRYYRTNSFQQTSVIYYTSKILIIFLLNPKLENSH